MNELAIIQPGQEMTVDGLKQQVRVIQEAMKSVMVKDTHYGTIPGCGDKPALLQPGAHKLGLLFNLAPEYRIETDNLPGGHREYEVVCVLTRRSDGLFVGQGVGVCSTLESKYRYRWENTGVEVPRNYWETRDQDLIGGPTFVPRKNNGKWMIFQRVEHDNPADYYNTVKKIAKKRAYNDAILTATGASDIFVPDDDTAPEYMSPDEKAVDDNGSNGSVDKPRRRSKRDGLATEAQRKMIYAKLKNAGIDISEFEEQFGALDELPFSEVNGALKWIENHG